MQQVIKRVCFTLAALSMVLNSLEATSFEDRKKTQMIQDLEVIKHHFEVGYAPAEWKKEYVDWDLNEAFEESKSRILATPSITTKQFQKIVRDFVQTMKDYHVSVLFFSTESASLPFSVKGIEDRYFIDWVDPLRLSSARYGISLGDELLEFGGRPVKEVVGDLRQESNRLTNHHTNQILAEMKLTIHQGMAGDDVPKGPILVTTKSKKTGKIKTHQLHWTYTPEHIRSPFDFIETLDFISGLFPKEKKLEMPKIKMANPLHEAYAQKYADRNGMIGSQKSFLPPLGEILWSNEDELKENRESSFYYAYIYEHPQGKKIGYIRIPHYLNEDFAVFGKLLNKMEEKTDLLVIDQLHNFGGLVHVQYILASMLTDKPLQTPYHRIKITQKDVIEAHRKLEEINLLSLALQLVDDIPKEEIDQDEKEEEEENREKILDYQNILFLKDYYELVLEDWNSGKTLTRPTPILGVDKINPHPKYQYTKPILFLINEMDFSGGDFVPAILQDNKRATLFGNRTAGAGGYVFRFEFPNTHGIAMCSYTVSIAERVNSKKIENLGVTPDIPYRVTLEDVQNGYRGYIRAVNEAIQVLLKSDEEISLENN